MEKTRSCVEAIMYVWIRFLLFSARFASSTVHVTVTSAPAAAATAVLSATMVDPQTEKQRALRHPHFSCLINIILLPLKTSAHVEQK